MVKSKMNFTKSLLAAIEAKTGKTWDVNTIRNKDGELCEWYAYLFNGYDRVSVVCRRDVIVKSKIFVIIVKTDGDYQDTVIEEVGVYDTKLSPNFLREQLIKKTARKL